MSNNLDSVEHEYETESLLLQILKELKLMNARLEEAYDTKLEMEDVEK